MKRTLLLLLLGTSMVLGATTKIREGDQTQGPLPTAQGGVPAGGSTNYVLKKNSGTDYDYSWSAAGGAVSSVFGRTGTVTAAAGDYSIEQLSEFDGTSSIVWNHDVDGETSFTVSNTNVGTGPHAALKAGYGGVGADNAWFTKYQDTYADGTGVSLLNLPDNGDWAASLEIYSGLYGNLFLTTRNQIRFGVKNGLGDYPDILTIDTSGITAGSLYTFNGNGSNLTGITATQVGAQASDTQLTSLAALSYTSNALKTIRVNAGATAFELSSAGTGTVTATGGSLTSNSIVLGAGTTDTKVSTGMITDGASKLTLGLNTSTLGQIKMFGNTSGDATIQPAAAAGTATVVTLPNATSTLPIYGQQITYSGPTAARTITYPDASITVARTDAANTFTGHQTIEGVTSTGATGSGKFVFDGTPTIATPSFTTGFTIGGAAASGKIPIGNGTNYVASTPTYPTTAGSSGVLLASDGTNIVTTTPTFPTAASPTSGNIIQSDGTNWTSAANVGGWTALKVSGSDFTTSSTSLVDITGLVTGTLSTATLYEFEAVLYLNSSSSAGMALGVQQSGTGSGQIGVWTGTITNGTTTANAVGSNTLNTACNANLLINGDGSATMKGFIKTGSTGSPTISCKALKTTSGTAKVYIGSVFRYRTG